MEIWTVLLQAEVPMPVPEIIVTLAALSLCMLFRFNRAGLLISYLFVFHMGWLLCQNELVQKHSEYGTFALAYLLLGAVVLCLSAYGMIFKRH